MTPEAAKPVPDTDAALTVTAELPVADRTTVCVAGMLATTSPKSMLVVLALRVDVPRFSCMATLWVAPPALAVTVAVSAEFTGEMLAVKPALDAPAGTMIEAGTLTSELLLNSVTANPPLAAAAFNVTVQLSVPDPVMERFAQLSPVNIGTPVPLTPINIELPLAELLVTESCPLAVPAAAGSNCTVTDVDCPGASVAGRPPPEIENPAPEIAAALTVTGMVPVEDRTREFVIGEFTGTFPNVTLGALTAKTAVAAFNSTAKLSATPPVLAVNVAACVVVTADAAAEKSALFAPAGTVTDAGTTTALSLLVKLIAWPLLPAAAFRVTVQVSAALPRIVPFKQLSPVSMGTPIPLKATVFEVPFEALLEIVSWPVAAPDAVGTNWSVSVTLSFAPTVIGMLPPPLMVNV